MTLEPHTMAHQLRVLDNTALSDFRTCRWKYWAGMEKHHRSGITTAPLHYGTVMHKLLEVFYKTHDPGMAILVGRKLYEGKEPRSDDYRTLDRAELVFREFVEHYGTPNGKNEATVGFPAAPAIEISTSVRLPLADVDYAVRIDRLVRINGLLYVEDHKTTSQMGSTFFQEFDMSPQMMGYTRVAELLTGERVHGVRINAICTRKKDHEFARQIVNYSKPRLDAWERQVAHHVGEIQERMASGIWPKDYACTPKYGKCTYFDICTLPDDLQERALEADFPVAPWNPLALHEDE